MRQSVIVDLYPGAYGQTLRIDVQSREALVDLHRLFEAMSRSTPLTKLILREALRDPLAGPQLVLVAARAKTEHRVRVHPDHIEWAADAEGWFHTVGLVEGLLAAHCPGHQYVDSGPTTEALVEIAFQEDPSRPSPS